MAYAGYRVHERAGKGWFLPQLRYTCVPPERLFSGLEPRSVIGLSAIPNWPAPLRPRDFMVHHSGDVAVATFLHDRDTPYYGQILHQIYRSIETWAKRGAARKMIASQGRQLPADPPVASLSPKELDGYAGVYSAGSDRTVTIFRQGDELAASTSGEPIARLAAEVRDVFHARLAAQEHRLSARRKRSRHGICEPSRRAQFAVLQDLGHRTRQAAWRQPRLRKLGSSGLRMAPTKACPPVQSGIWTK